MKFLSIFILLFFCIVTAQTQSFSTIKSEMLKRENKEDSLAYLELQLNKPTLSKETKKEVLTLIGYINEQTNNYESAQDAYTQASKLAETHERAELQLSAAYCALSVGDTESASLLVNSSLLTAQSQETLIKARLYAIWVDIVIDTPGERYTENMNTLQFLLKNTYNKKSKASILFTLWWLTSDEKFAQELRRDFATSPETAILNGTITVLPAPFIYFSPRIEAVRASSSF